MVIPVQTLGQNQPQEGSLASQFKGMPPVIHPPCWNGVVTEACSGHSGPGSRVRAERRKNHASDIKASPGDPLPPGTLDLLSLLQSGQDHWSLVDPEPSENPVAGRQSHRSCSSLDLIKGVP